MRRDGPGRSWVPFQAAPGCRTPESREKRPEVEVREVDVAGFDGEIVKLE